MKYLLLYRTTTLTCCHHQLCGMFTYRKSKVPSARKFEKSDFLLQHFLKKSLNDFDFLFYKMKACTQVKNFHNLTHFFTINIKTTTTKVFPSSIKRKPTWINKLVSNNLKCWIVSNSTQLKEWKIAWKEAHSAVCCTWMNWICKPFSQLKFRTIFFPFSNWNSNIYVFVVS